MSRKEEHIIREEEQIEFNNVNINDKYYINIKGFKEYRNFVDRILEKEYKDYIRQFCEDYLNKNSEYMPVAKRRFPGMKKIFPNLFPNISLADMERLTSDEVDEIVYRFTKYKF